MTFYLFLLLFVSVIYMASGWLIFSKAQRPGWMAIIPVFNTLVLLEIVNKPWWWIFLFLIPGINIIFIFWTIYLLSKYFGKNVSFAAGLFFLPFIFVPVLGFGNAQYLNPLEN